jgi:hypothetical protein
MNQLVVTIIILLIPGIIAVIISDKITVHSKWDSFKYGLYSFLLGVITYSFLQLIIYSIDITRCFWNDNIYWNHLNIWTIAISEKTKVSGWEVFFATMLAIPVAFLSSWFINFKIFNKIAQKIKVTSKYGDENLFSYYLNAKEINWLYIRDPERNLTYQGKIVSYSENQTIQEIVLSDVTVFQYIDSAELYSIPTIYLTKPLGQFIIEAVPKELLGGEDEETVN